MVSKREQALGRRGLLWIRRHRLKTLLLLLLAILCLSLIKPISWDVTHFDPQDCGHFTSNWFSQKTTSSTTPALAARCFLMAHQQCRVADIVSAGYGFEGPGETIISTTNVLGGCAITFASPISVCRVPFYGCLFFKIVRAWSPDFICHSLQSGQNRFFFTNCSDDLGGRCLILDHESGPELKTVYTGITTEADCLGQSVNDGRKREM